MQIENSHFTQVLCSGLLVTLTPHRTATVSPEHSVLTWFNKHNSIGPCCGHVKTVLTAFSRYIPLCRGKDTRFCMACMVIRTHLLCSMAN